MAEVILLSAIGGALIGALVATVCWWIHFNMFADRVQGICRRADDEIARLRRLLEEQTK